MSYLDDMENLHQDLAERVAKGDDLGSVAHAMLDRIGDSPAFRDLVERKRKELKNS